WPNWHAVPASPARPPTRQPPTSSSSGSSRLASSWPFHGDCRRLACARNTSRRWRAIRAATAWTAIRGRSTTPSSSKFLASNCNEATERKGLALILAAGLTPAWQQILQFDALAVGEVNRATDVQWCASGKVLNVGIALGHLGAESLTLAPLGGP